MAKSRHRCTACLALRGDLASMVLEGAAGTNLASGWSHLSVRWVQDNIVAFHSRASLPFGYADLYKGDSTYSHAIIVR
jgi:hypothetical protein